MMRLRTTLSTNARAKARVAAIAVAAALAGLAPTPLSGAERVSPGSALRLSAGEHGAFSRVVLRGAPRNGWRLLSGKRRFDLRVPGAFDGVDDAPVTRHRRAHRVLTVRSRREGDETVLSFSLNCDCAARPRVARSGALIIDVAPRAGADRNAKEAAGAIETANTPRTAPLDVDGARAFLMEQLKRAARQGLIQYKDGQKPSQMADPASAENDASRAAKTGGSAKTAEAAKDASAKPNVEAASARASADDALSHSAIELGPAPTGAAASTPQGGPPAPRETDAATPKQATRAAGAPARKADQATASPANAAPHQSAAQPQTADKEDLKAFFSKQKRSDTARPASSPQTPKASASAKASTSDGASEPRRPPVDAARTMAEDPPAAQPEPKAAAAAPAESRIMAACPAEHLLDPRTWPYQEDYFQSLSESRSSLFDELNRVDPRALAHMQLLYLAQGFGHEAAAAPAGFGVRDDIVDLLAALGDVMAHRAPEPGTPFNRAEPCPGRQAFWQAVALSETEPSRALAAYRDSQRALWRTPTKLRRLAGERIALAAARIGDLRTAAEILSVLERSQLPPTPGLRIVRAELALANGRTIAAQRNLEDVAKSRDENNLLAALKLARSFSQPYEADRALELADLLADFAMQRRGSQDMIDAITAEAKLRARFGRLPDALTAIEVSQRYGGYGEDALEALRVELLEAAIASLGHDDDPNRVAKGEDGERRPAAARRGRTGDYVTGDAKANRRAPARRRSAKLDKKALALASQLIEETAALPAGPQNDRLRIDLAEQVTALGAPHLAPLVIDDALAARSKSAAAARADAAEAAALIDPLGALTPNADALSGGEKRVGSALDSLISELEAAETKALIDATAPAEERESNGDAPSASSTLKALRSRKDAPPSPARTIEDGQSLLKGINDDLELLRGLTTKQKSTPAPKSAPHAASGEAGSLATTGGTDG